MSVVYVVEPPHPGRFVDLTPAEAYGRVEVLIDRRDTALAPAPMVWELQRKLRNFSDDDYLLCLGDPTAIAIAGAVAAAMNRDRLKLLKWDKKRRCYLELRVDVRKGKWNDDRNEN